MSTASRRAAVLAVAALCGTPASVAAAEPPDYVAKVEAERFTIQGDAIRTYDAWASGTSALLLGGQRSSGRTAVTLDRSVRAVVVRAKSQLCAGSATAVVTVDGRDIGSVSPPEEDFAEFTLPAALAAGAHELAVTFVNDHYVPSTCDRNFIVDNVAFEAVPPSPTLISQGKPTTASSVERNTQALDARFAVDGDMATRWSSSWGDPQWLMVDLSGYFRIDQVKLRWEAAYGRAYQLQVSTDAVNWQTVQSVETGDGGVDDHSGLSAAGRFVRVHGTSRGTGWGYSLHELQVYGTPAPLPSLKSAKTGVPVMEYWNQPEKVSALNANWTYNWNRSGVVTGGLDYVPMVWGPDSARKDPNDPDPAQRPKQGDCYKAPLQISDATIDELQAGKAQGRYDTLLGFNEPDMGLDQACLSPQQAIDLWPRLMETGLRLGAPAPAWADSGWLDQFMDMAIARGYRVDFLPLHFYQDFTNPAAAQQVIDMVTRLHTKYKKPIWVTEIGAFDLRAWGMPIKGTPTHEKADDYMREVLRFLEGTPYVERYAWFSDNCWAIWPECRYGSLYDSSHAMTSHGRTYADPRSGWTASASHAPAEANNALDGRPGTRWSTNTAQAPGQWFRVDMASRKVLNRIRIDAGPSTGDQPRGYVVQVSPDGTNWVEVGKGQATSQAFTVAFTPRSARYVQVRQTGSAGNWWSIHEMTFN